MGTISIPGIACDCCGKEEPLLHGYKINFHKITSEKVLSPGEVGDTEEKNNYLCGDCYNRILRSFSDVQDMYRKNASITKKKPVM